MEIKRSLAKVAVLCTLGWAAAGCATLSQGRQFTPERRAQSLQSALTGSGFTMVPATNQQQMSKLKALPPLKLNYYVDRNGQLHYWLADPFYCRCLYDGDAIAFQRYQSVKIQDELLARQQAAQSYYQSRQMMLGMPVTSGFLLP